MIANEISLVDSSVVKEVETSGYMFAPPATLFGHLTPPEVSAELRSRWLQEHGSQHIRFYILHDVFVSVAGLVFDRDKNLIRETITQHSAADIASALKAIEQGLVAGVIPSLQQPHLLCGKIGMTNYGHWMAEILPIAYLARRELISMDWHILLPDVRPWIADTIHDSLDLLGCPRDTRVSGNAGVFHVAELIVVTGLSQHGHFYSSVALDCAEYIGRSIAPEVKSKIWMTRLGERRALLNEAAAIEALHDFGWIVLNPARLPFREQIAWSKAASHMAGVQGAGLTNLLFMPPDAKLTTFVPATMPDVFYWSLARHKGLDYCEVRCPHLIPHDWPISWDAELAVSIPDLLALISR